MVITAAMVGELRAKTDAPMMECKKALIEAEGNFDKAEEILRVKLGNKAGKASSRITAEGIVACYIDGQVGSMIEVNCETDFVTKNDSFLCTTKTLGPQVSKQTRMAKKALTAVCCGDALPTTRREKLNR